jgi:hypothetical protein
MLATFCLIMYLRNPDFLNEVWLWIVGLFATGFAYLQSLWNSIKSKVLSLVGADTAKEQKTNKVNTSGTPSTTSATAPLPDQNTLTELQNLKTKEASLLEQVKTLQLAVNDKDKNIAALHEKIASIQKPDNKPVDPFSGSSIYLLRYIDDGQTTIGLLYVDDEFFCYTLEDTYRKEKIAGKTRIQAGDYVILFNKNPTKLTEKYRNKPFTKGWFTWHLHLQDVPDFLGIYIHAGGDSGDTDGCILVSDGLTSSGGSKTFTNSKKTFENLYKRIAQDLEANVPVRIRVYDEHWFSDEFLNR